MEPQAFPQNDPGPRALMTSLSSAENLDRLRWLLAHAGAMSASPTRLGGDCAASGSPAWRSRWTPVAGRDRPPRLAVRGRAAGGTRVARRCSTRSGAATSTWWSTNRSDDIDVKLAQLELIAHDKGDALGLAGAPSPVVVQHIAAWANGLLEPRPGTGAGQRPGAAAVGRGSLGHDAMSPLPYRPNVGAVLFNRDGRVFVARRADLPNAEGAPGGWQLPQGGIDEDEDPRSAVLRELAEEIGTGQAEIMAEHPEWLTYDLPPHLLGVALRGRYRGQRQRWFALRFTGEDSRHQAGRRSASGIRCLALGGTGRAAGAGGAISSGRSTRCWPGRSRGLPGTGEGSGSSAARCTRCACLALWQKPVRCDDAAVLSPDGGEVGDATRFAYARRIGGVGVVFLLTKGKEAIQDSQRERTHPPAMA